MELRLGGQMVDVELDPNIMNLLLIRVLKALPNQKKTQLKNFTNMTLQKKLTNTHYPMK